MTRSVMLALLVTAASSGADKWVRAISPNFELYTPQSERHARERILYFEQIREFFSKAVNTRPDSHVPVRIVLFGSESQYKPYRPNEVAAAFYQPSLDRDYVVIGGYSPKGDRTAVHEYVHLMVRHAHLNLPVWLNEGIAEFYSTAQPVGNKVMVGHPIAGRVYELQHSWIPLTRILEVGHASAEYNRKAHAGTFYAESWALTHMLALSEPYSKKFSEFFRQVAGGTDSVKAIESIYGRPISEIDADLRAYVRTNNRFYAAVFPVKFEKASAAPEISAVDAVTAKVVCAGVLVGANRIEDARPALDELEKSNLDRPEAAEVLAYAAWRAQDFAKASLLFEKAVAAPNSHPKLLLDAARVRMYADKTDQKAVDWLNRVLSARPEWIEARLQLIEQLLTLGRAKESLAEVRVIKKVDPRYASRFFRVASYAEAANGLVPQAANAAESAAKYAGDAWEKDAVVRLRQYLTRMEEFRRAQTATPARVAVAAAEFAGGEALDRTDMEMDRPRLVRRSASGDERIIEVAKGEQVEVVEGTLVQVDCMESKARLHIDSGGTRVALAILDPGNIVVRSASNAEGHFELQCGPQRKKIRADYIVKDDTALGTKGVLKILELTQ